MGRSSDAKTAETKREERRQALVQLRRKRTAQLGLVSRNKRIAGEYWAKGLGAAKRAEELAREIRKLERGDA